MFETYNLANKELQNRFVFPPIKTGYGNPDGTISERQLIFYRQISEGGPGTVILEPVAVTINGREHPKQLAVHLDYSGKELKKIVEVIHNKGRVACLHLNHAGAAANPKACGGEQPKAPSSMTCPTTGQTSEPLTREEIELILEGYHVSAQRAVEAGFDFIEIQGGHGYLISQFLNGKINKRSDDYGQERTLFARQVFEKVRLGAPNLPLLLRISGNEMSPEWGINKDDLLTLIKLAQEMGVVAIHVGMGNSCFSPPWYFHHASLPTKPQEEALSWLRKNTELPLIVAGRMGRKERVLEVLENGLADLVAIGRPLLADTELLEKWKNELDGDVMYCGYCLQGCLHRLKNAQPLGCNLNPELANPPLGKTEKPIHVLVVGGGPAGLSTAYYMAKRGHRVSLVEKKDHLGGQFALAWKCPGKLEMRQGLESLERRVRKVGVDIYLNREFDSSRVEELKPHLLVWAAGAQQNIPEIEGLDQQYVITSLEYLEGAKEVKGPRVLVIGAGRVGLEIAEKLGKDSFEVVATKRTDPIGSMMEMITKKLAIMRIQKMDNVSILPHTTIKQFLPDCVLVEKDGQEMKLEPFQTVILASGMVPVGLNVGNVKDKIPSIEIIGDAKQVGDIYTAIHNGYELALKY